MKLKKCGAVRGYGASEVIIIHEGAGETMRPLS
jgi:hypothetical protein